MSPAVPAALVPSQTFPELSYCVLCGACGGKGDMEWGGQGHICLASSLIKEFDEVHYWLFGRQPIMALTGGRGYLGFGFFCV